MKLLTVGFADAANHAAGIINESGNLTLIEQEEVAAAGLCQKSIAHFQSGIPLLFTFSDHLDAGHAIASFAKSFSNPGVVLFDAHPDSESDDDILPSLVLGGLVKPQNILVVGVRSWKKQEIEFLRNHKIKHYSMKEISMEGSEDVCDAVMSVAKDFGALHISIDLDVIDPAFAPAVDSPSPGGMQSRELLYFIQRLKMLKNIKSADVSNFVKCKDSAGITSLAAAKILSELC